jgi:hypothetical protein
MPLRARERGLVFGAPTNRAVLGASRTHHRKRPTRRPEGLSDAPNPRQLRHAPAYLHITPRPLPVARRPLPAAVHPVASLPGSTLMQPVSIRGGIGAKLLTSQPVQQSHHSRRQSMPQSIHWCPSQVTGPAPHALVPSGLNTAWEIHCPFHQSAREGPRASRICSTATRRQASIRDWSIATRTCVLACMGFRRERRRRHGKRLRARDLRLCVCGFAMDALVRAASTDRIKSVVGDR